MIPGTHCNGHDDRNGHFPRSNRELDAARNVVHEKFAGLVDQVYAAPR